MFKRIDDTTEIDTDFITCAEYELFLDEMRAQKKYYQPDHWTARIFFETTPKLSATDPVLGVRAEDAKIFVIWLNKREKATYRLPTPTEAKEFPSNMESVATWCYENEKFTLEGLTKSEYQGIEQRLKKLSTLPLSEWINLFVSFSNFYSTLSRCLYRDLDRTYYLRRDLDRTFVLDHLYYARSRYLALALDLADTISRELYTLLNARQFDTALSKIQQRQNDSPSVVQQRRLTLLIDLIHCQTATTPSGIRQAFRKYVVHLLENIWIGLNELKKEKTEEIGSRPGWQFWKQHFPKVAKTDYLERKQEILECYWQLKIIEAREAGELPAWEGIRLVRVTSEQAL